VITVPILWFLITKWKEPKTAKDDVKDIINGFSIVPLNERIIQNSFESKMEDFEDAIQFYSALEAKCAAIITRNKRDFEISTDIVILTPEEFLSKEGMK
jgi:predicted nucleic acid-binding protein